MAVIVNITNAHDDKSQWNESGGYWDINVRTDDGFVFQGDVKAVYTNTSGYPKSVVLEMNGAKVWAFGNLTGTNAKTKITITGKTESGNDATIEISTNLSNCTANKDLPQYAKNGETVSVTLTANDGTEFDTGKSTPHFYYMNASGYPQAQNLNISTDKKTATGSIQVNTDWKSFTVIGSAYPVTVVGEQYGAINVYLVTLDELAEFSKKRFFKETGSDPETGAPIYENIDLGAYVNKIRRVYTNIGASSTDVIRCGNYNTGVSCHQPAQDKITLDFGTAVVPAHNEDNTDYESEIQIFLPFAGFVNLNNAYAGKTIGLQYVINVVTGNGVALLSCNGVVFQVEETEPSSEIIHLSPSTQVKTVGGDDWNEMLYYGLEPYIYCKWYESASNGRNNDRQTGILVDFRGFNVFDDVTPIHTAEMLAEEQELIYTALSDGVYIE